MKLSPFPAFLFFFYFCTSCKKDADNCIQFRTAYIAEHNGTYYGSTGENIPIVVYYMWPNLCGSKGFLETEKDGNVTTIRAIATVEECGGCFDMPARMQDTFYFSERTPGTYYLKLIARGEPSMDTVIIR
jgi:hypothetical protein